MTFSLPGSMKRRLLRKGRLERVHPPSDNPLSPQACFLCVKGRQD